MNPAFQPIRHRAAFFIILALVMTVSLGIALLASNQNRSQTDRSAASPITPGQVQTEIPSGSSQDKKMLTTSPYTPEIAKYTQQLQQLSAQYTKTSSSSKKRQLLKSMTQAATSRRNLLRKEIFDYPNAFLTDASLVNWYASQLKEIQQALKNYIEQPVNISGTFTNVIMDGVDASETLSYTITRSDGKRFTLSLAGTAPKLPTGTQITLNGIMISTTIALAPAGILPNEQANTLLNIKTSGEGIQAINPVRANGPKKTLIIPFRFSNLSFPAGVTETSIRQVYSDNPESVRNYFIENSYGTLRFTKADGSPGVDMAPIKSINMAGDSSCGTSYTAWQNEADRLNASLSPESYDLIIYVSAFIPSTTCPYIGISDQDGKRTWHNGFYYNGSNGNFYNTRSVAAHEIGHTFGLYHAGNLICANRSLTIASYSQCVPDEDNLFDPTRKQISSLTHYTAAGKDALGWIPPQRIISAAGGTNTYQIVPLSNQGTEPVTIKIPKTNEGADEYYYLDYRTFSGFDGITTPELPYGDPNNYIQAYPGVHIHVWNNSFAALPGGSKRPLLLTAQPSDLNPFKNARLPLNTPIQLLPSGTTVTLTGADANHATIQVTVPGNPPPPTNPPPGTPIPTNPPPPPATPTPQAYRVRRSVLSLAGDRYWQQTCNFDLNTGGPENPCGNTPSLWRERYFSTIGAPAAGAYTTFWFKQRNATTGVIEDRIRQTLFDATGTNNYYRTCPFDRGETDDNASTNGTAGCTPWIGPNPVNTTGFPGAPAYSGYTVIVFEHEGRYRVRRSVLSLAGDRYWQQTCDFDLNTGGPANPCGNTPSLWRERYFSTIGAPAAAAYTTFLFKLKNPTTGEIEDRIRQTIFDAAGTNNYYRTCKFYRWETDDDATTNRTDECTPWIGPNPVNTTGFPGAPSYSGYTVIVFEKP